MRKSLLIGTLISVGCLYFAFKGIAFKDVAAAIAQANSIWLLMALTVYACGFLFRAIRWKILFEPIKNVSSTALMRPMIIGFFANNVLPFRMGELVRAYVTGHKINVSRTTSLGTIVLERIFDTITFLSMFLIVALFFPFPEGIKRSAYGLGVACVGVIAALIFASKHQHTANRLVNHLPVSETLRMKLQDLLLNFVHGLSGITQGHYVVKAMATSVAVWIAEGTNVYCIVHAFPIAISYAQAYFVLFFLGLSVTLPQAPGYVGTVELFGVMALSLLGIPKEKGLPVILTIHGIQFCFIGSLGCLALWKEGLSLGKLLNCSEISPEK